MADQSDKSWHAVPAEAAVESFLVTIKELVEQCPHLSAAQVRITMENAAIGASALRSSIGSLEAHKVWAEAVGRIADDTTMQREVYMPARLRQELDVLGEPAHLRSVKTLHQGAIATHEALIASRRISKLAIAFVLEVVGDKRFDYANELEECYESWRELASAIAAEKLVNIRAIDKEDE